MALSITQTLPNEVQRLYRSSETSSALRSQAEIAFLVDEFCRTHLPPNFQKTKVSASDFDGPMQEVCFNCRTEAIHSYFVVESIAGRTLQLQIGDYLNYAAMAQGSEPETVLKQLVHDRNNLKHDDRTYRRGRKFTMFDIIGSSMGAVGNTDGTHMKIDSEHKSVPGDVKDPTGLINAQLSQLRHLNVTRLKGENDKSLKWDQVVLIIGISDCTTAWNILRLFFAWTAGGSKAAEICLKDFRIEALTTWLERDDALRNVKLTDKMFYHEVLDKRYRLIHTDIIFLFYDLMAAGLLTNDNLEVSVKLVPRVEQFHERGGDASAVKIQPVKVDNVSQAVKPEGSVKRKMKQETNATVVAGADGQTAKKNRI